MAKKMPLNLPRQLNSSTSVIGTENGIGSSRELEAIVASISMEAQSFMNHLPDMSGAFKELMKDVDWSIFEHQQYNCK